MRELSHDQASELLRPLLDRALDPEQAEAVETHLLTCNGCRQEVRGLTALVAAGEAASGTLTEIESARLRRGVFEATGLAVPGGTRKPLMTRLAPALGVAATLALLAVGLTQIELSGSDSGDSDTATSGEELADEAGRSDLSQEVARLEMGERVMKGEAFSAGAEDAGAPVGAPQEAQLKAPADAAEESGDSAAGGGATNGATAGRDVPSRPGPRFRSSVGNVSREALARFAATRPPFTNFARAYEESDVARLRDGFLGTLARKGGRAGSADINDCAARAGGGDLLPAYGALGTFEGTPALILGFVSTPGSGPLDRYTIAVWQRDDCDTLLHLTSGTINP
jgi:hypothetical protein